MFRNMACSLIRSVREYPEYDQKERLALGLGYKPKVPGRIVTTLPKAKELRPFVEKLITLARKAAPHEERAQEFATSADRNSDEWKSWRESEQWNRWNQAIAPAVAIRRRVFSLLRDKEAVDVLFEDLVPRFLDRPGGYTRVVRVPETRLGDAGQQALIEFVGERDRVRARRQAPVVADEPEEEEETSPAPQPEAEPSAEEAASEEPGAPPEESAEATQAEDDETS